MDSVKLTPLQLLIVAFFIGKKLLLELTTHNAVSMDQVVPKVLEDADLCFYGMMNMLNCVGLQIAFNSKILMKV